MTDIPDFTDDEIKNVQQSINGRYGEEIELQLADAEIRPDPSARDLIEAPVFFRAEREANFVTTTQWGQADHAAGENN